MGVFSGGGDRSISHHSSCLNNMAPIQGGNDVYIALATVALQYTASLDADGVQQSAQKLM